MSSSDPFFLTGFRVALRSSGLVFSVALGLAILDALDILQLPQPFRGAIPWLLIVSATVGITLLVGALGTPKRTAAPPDPSDD